MRHSLDLAEEVEAEVSYLPIDLLGFQVLCKVIGWTYSAKPVRHRRFRGKVLQQLLLNFSSYLPLATSFLLSKLDAVYLLASHGCHRLRKMASLPALEYRTMSTIASSAAALVTIRIRYACRTLRFQPPHAVMLVSVNLTSRCLIEAPTHHSTSRYLSMSLPSARAFLDCSSDVHHLLPFAFPDFA